MNWMRAVWVALFVSPLLVVLAFGFGRNPKAVPFMLKDRPAPSFRLSTLGGQTYTSRDLAGKPSIINFWATWCVPCVQEHGLLQSAARYYGEHANFVGVVYQDDELKAKQYLDRYGSSFPQLWDTGSAMAIDFGVAGVPESFIIDAGGVVRYKREGVMTRAILEAELEPLLKQAPGPQP